MTQFRHERLEQYVEKNKNRARLLIHCKDRPGIVAAVSNFLYENGANIVESSQYSTNHENGKFFKRVEFEMDHLLAYEGQLEEKFQPIAETFQMNWRMSYASKLKRMGIFVSKMEHCLLELLWRWQAGDLMCEIPFVISNHEDLRETVESLHIPYHYIPVTKETKDEAEKQQHELLDGTFDFIVLARYMQILSPTFVKKYPNQIINIHHSFLPAFIGGRPYERAYERGVKLIGATSHYVTDELDEGPIIEQDVHRVNHKYDVEELKRTGREIERSVLAKAVRWHIEDRIVVDGNKTIVFD